MAAAICDVETGATDVGGVEAIFHGVDGTGKGGFDNARATGDRAAASTFVGARNATGDAAAAASVATSAGETRGGVTTAVATADALETASGAIAAGAADKAMACGGAATGRTTAGITLALADGIAGDAKAQSDAEGFAVGSEALATAATEAGDVVAAVETVLLAGADEANAGVDKVLAKAGADFGRIGESGSCDE